MCKTKFTLDGIIGHRYGSLFVVQDGQLVKSSCCNLAETSTDQGTAATSENIPYSKIFSFN